MGPLKPLSLSFADGALVALDQRKLPLEMSYLTLRTVADVREAICSMSIRGAPLIGIAAAYASVLASREYASNLASIAQQIDWLESSRPTAVNLRWALQRMRRILHAASNNLQSPDELSARLLHEANAIMTEDRACNLAIAAHGAALLPRNANVIHHCNTGSLATSDYGTALGVIRWAHEQGQGVHVYLDETRPRLQGAALSAFEMQHYGVPHTLIVDGASGLLMRQRKIDACIVGCDRVAANGDTANKIGTYNLALVAKAHAVPFYVACPVSSIDASLASGETIEIEHRSGAEVTTLSGQQLCPPGTPAWNPAFDITPEHLITAFITEQGVIRPPFADQLRTLAQQSRQVLA